MEKIRKVMKIRVFYDRNITRIAKFSEKNVKSQFYNGKITKFNNNCFLLRETRSKLLTWSAYQHNISIYF